MNKYYVVSQRLDGKWQILKEGNKKATRICNNGIELQREIGWMVINRECNISIYINKELKTIIQTYKFL